MSEEINTPTNGNSDPPDLKRWADVFKSRKLWYGLVPSLFITGICVMQAKAGLDTSVATIAVFTIAGLFGLAVHHQGRVDVQEAINKGQ